jgi:hypothetical protein
MTLSEIKSKIVENRETVKQLQDQLRQIGNESRKLQETLREKEIEAFSEYIELDTIYNITRFAMFTGVQIQRPKENDKLESPYFRAGDTIQVVKKNKKSFVIKCLKRGDKTPNTLFRIEIEQIYQYFLGDKTLKLGFETFLNRKESLNILGI